MKKYIAVLEIEDDEEIVHAEVTYFYSNNGITYKATEKMELKEESEDTKNKTYEDGLNEAWEAARKMYQFNPINNKQLCEELYDMGFNEFICSTTASEAIKQVKEYKEKQEEIKVGDEVTDWNGEKGVVTKISPDYEYLVVVLESGIAIR